MILLVALLGCATLAPIGPSPVDAAFALQADRARPSVANVTYGLPGADAEVLRLAEQATTTPAPAASGGSATQGASR